jgi:glucokinase
VDRGLKEDDVDIHARHALVADIGGTYLSFAVADIDELTIDHFALLTAADFDTPMEALERYLRALPKCPGKVCFAVAGEVEGDTARMTYRPWTFTAAAIRSVTGAEVVTIVNDVEALALALPHLTRDELIPVKDGVRNPAGAKAVINSGTGLGIASLVPSGGGWVVHRHASEGFAPPSPQAGEFDYRTPFPRGGDPSAEDLFSGTGLIALYRGLAAHYGQTAAHLNATEITAAARGKADRAAVEAIRLMGLWYARFAGGVALQLGADGGLFLAGGLSANVVPAMGRDAFAAAFTGGDARLDAVPVSAIKTGADAGLRGAAVALARHLDTLAAPGARRAG